MRNRCISRFVGSSDHGRIRDARSASGPLRGGIIMGLGLALMEEAQFEERLGAPHYPEPRGASGADVPRRAAIE